MKNLFLFLFIGFNFHLFGQTSNILPKYADSISTSRQQIDLSITFPYLRPYKTEAKLLVGLTGTSISVRDNDTMQVSSGGNPTSLSQYLNSESDVYSGSGIKKVPDSPKKPNKKQRKRN